MARKNGSDQAPLVTFDSAVEADVSIAHLAPSIPGARPTPYVHLRFISPEGESLGVSMTARGAARFLERLNSLHGFALIDYRNLGVGEQRNPVQNRFSANDPNGLRELPGFRALRCDPATDAQYAHLRRLAGADPGIEYPAEFFLTWIRVFATNEESKHVEADLLMDIWAAAALRDGIFAALDSAMPGKAQNDRGVQVVDGIVGTVSI